MSGRLETPASEAELAALVAAAREPLAIEGNGTKRAMLRPVQAAHTLSTRGLTGITLYKPEELIISARAGTPMPEIVAALAERGQHVIAESPSLGALYGASAPPTIGGIVSTNLSGPRRITAGATRDHVMGIRAVNGAGEVFRSGGRVLKNVTGLDLCKLLTGAHGTLGVITEVTLKVLPKPQQTGTVVLRVGTLAAGVEALSAGLGSPYGVSGAALLPDGLPTGGGGPVALLRLEEFAESIAYRGARLRDELLRFGEVVLLDEAASLPLWRDIAELGPLSASAGEAVWRVSVAPSAGPGVVAATGLRKSLLDWGGGLVWLAGPATQAAHQAVMAAALAAGGSFTLMRAPDSLRAAMPVLPAEPAALAAISVRVKAVMDPRGILNPGRMRAGP